MSKKRIWVKENGEEYKEEELIRMSFKDFKKTMDRIEDETAFSFLGKFREGHDKVKSSMSKDSVFLHYLSGIKKDLEDFYLEMKN